MLRLRYDAMFIALPFSCLSLFRRLRHVIFISLLNILHAAFFAFALRLLFVFIFACHYDCRFAATLFFAY